MTLKSEVELLRDVPAFRELSVSRMKLLAFSCARVEFASGDNIITQGEVGEYVFVILSGEAEVQLKDGNGQRFVRKVGQHDFVGEVAVTGNRPRSASVVACCDVAALQIGADVLASFIDEAPELARALGRHGDIVGYEYE